MRVETDERDGRGGEGERGRMAVEVGEREGGEVREALFLSLPESCPGLNGGKEARKNCVERQIIS